MHSPAISRQGHSVFELSVRPSVSPCVPGCVHDHIKSLRTRQS